MSSSAVSSCPGLLCFPVSGQEEEPTPLPCTVLERNGQWLCLHTHQPLSWAATVGVEYGELYCAGEVVSCVPQSQDVWLVQLELRQVITHLHPASPAARICCDYVSRHTLAKEHSAG